MSSLKIRIAIDVSKNMPATSNGSVTAHSVYVKGAVQDATSHDVGRNTADS